MKQLPENRTMKTIQILPILLFVVAIFVAMPAGASNSGSTRQTRDVKGFHGISVSNGVDLYITQKNVEEVVVEADQDDLDKIITTVEGGILKIYIREKSWFKINWNNAKRKVYVSVKELDKLYASAGADVVSESVLKLNKLDMDASSGSDIRLELEAGSLSADSSSGSDISLKGKVDILQVNASSGGDIDAGNLQSKKCRAGTSSGSDISIYVTDELNASASSGGDISYSGNPKIKDINESSGGDVRGR